MRPAKGAQREPEDIIFMEADAKWVHHPHANTLIITIKIANRIVHMMFVDNGSAINILFWNTYQKTGVTRSDLSPATSPLYGFIGDHVILKGTIKLATMLGDYPRVSRVVAEYLAIECPSAFNGVIGRPLLKALKAETSIHCLTIKFPKSAKIGQVQGKQ